MRVFKESQRFNQPWIIILIILTIVIHTIITVKQYLHHKIPLSEFIFALGLFILLGGFIFLFKLNTRIDEVGVHYQFFPFHWTYRVKKWNEIQQIYTRKYDPLTEYGGWGIKSRNLFKMKSGIAYNISGNIGIQLVLKNGKKILLGTHKQNEADSCINHYFNSNNHD
ncbi:hypothetical protein [Tenacibaculum amylolyticum]|uniref:hypothetical protein n=1 Tax=Tenacibaculum amylolyticum TaxID=104269 RepID=UPI00389582DF